jgi:hypothetical protein
LATETSENDRELVLQLLEDVRTIATIPNYPVPSPAAIRAFLVPVMRRWIVDGRFFAAQRLIAPSEIRFQASINEEAARLCEFEYTERWMAVIFFGEIGLGVSQTAQRYIGKAPPFREGELRELPHTAKSFFDQKMFFWKGHFYTRHDVIHVHANKLGGVHLDFRRAADQAHINEIRNYFGFDREAAPLGMLVGDQIAAARADPNRRQHIYDATDLVTLDTARIFASGVESAAPLFEALLR